MCVRVILSVVRVCVWSLCKLSCLLKGYLPCSDSNSISHCLCCNGPMVHYVSHTHTSGTVPIIRDLLCVFNARCSHFSAQSHMTMCTLVCVRVFSADNIVSPHHDTVREFKRS